MTTLADLKAQLNITDDTDDALLAAKMAAAEAFTSGTIDAETPVVYGDAPADLQQAILLLAAHWYENREATLVGINAAELPMGYRDIVSAYRKWVF